MPATSGAPLALQAGDASSPLADLQARVYLPSVQALALTQPADGPTTTPGVVAGASPTVDPIQTALPTATESVATPPTLAEPSPTPTLPGNPGATPSPTPTIALSPSATATPSRIPSVTTTPSSIPSATTTPSAIPASDPNCQITSVQNLAVLPLNPWPLKFATSTTDQVTEGTLQATAGTTPTAYDGVPQVFVAAPGGSNNVCISCAPLAGSGAPAPGLAKVMPFIRAQNDWIAFGGEMASHPPFPPLQYGAGEEQNGFWADLWVTNPSGTAWYNLTNYSVPTNGAFVGTLAPQFSPDGSKIAWAKPVANADSTHPMGYWQIWVANFSVANGVPALANAHDASGPNGSWFEPEAWSPDSTTLLVSSDMGLPYQFGMDLFALNVATGQWSANLTNSPLQWDEQSGYSASGKKIVWMSSNPNSPLLPQDAGLPAFQVYPQLQTEFWIMNADGTDQERITGFDAPLPTGVPDPEYNPTVNNLVFGAVWNQNGTQIIVPQGQLDLALGKVVVTHKWLITFAGPCGSS